MHFCWNWAAVDAHGTMMLASVRPAGTSLRPSDSRTSSRKTLPVRLMILVILVTAISRATVSQDLRQLRLLHPPSSACPRPILRTSFAPALDNAGVSKSNVAIALPDDERARAVITRGRCIRSKRIGVG